MITGGIGWVVAVNLIIWTGLVLYLLRLDGRLRSLEPLGTAWACPGISTERMHLYLAPYDPADRVSQGGGLADEHEDIESGASVLFALNAFSRNDLLTS